MVEIVYAKGKNFRAALQEMGRSNPLRFTAETYLNMGRVTPVLSTLAENPQVNDQTVLMKNAKGDTNTTIHVLSGPHELDDLLSRRHDKPGLPKEGTAYVASDSAQSKPTLIVPIVDGGPPTRAIRIAQREFRNLGQSFEDLEVKPISSAKYRELVLFLINNDLYVPRPAVRYAGIRDYEIEVREKRRRQQDNT